MVSNQTLAIDGDSTNASNMVRTLLFKHARLSHFLRTCCDLAKALIANCSKSTYKFGDVEKTVMKYIF